MTPSVLIGIPAGNGWIFGPTAESCYALHGHDGPTMARFQSGSLLTLSFNRLLGHARAAYKAGLITHFAMVHADIVPAGPWLATLLAELQRLQADVLSCVTAIKDTHGLTSTALGHPHDVYDYRRITTTELAHLPESFAAATIKLHLDWPRREDVLLVNTGCWLTRMDAPCWWAEQDGCYLLRFHMHDRQQVHDGRLPVTECAPEDWTWSRDLHRMGASVYATRKVPIYHATTHLWGVRPAWGSETDQEAEDFRRQYARPDLRPND